MNVLFIGDVIGRPGRVLVRHFLPHLVEKEEIAFIIANGENSAGGFGITEKTAGELFDCGVHVITTGNHVWDKKEAVSYVAKEDRILRPMNYAPGVPGFGSIIYSLKNGLKAGVINLTGRVFMAPSDCPFRTVMTAIEEIKRHTNIIIVDMHAEATSEKQAMGYYLNGSVSAVIGTHTHVQTADEQILSNHTAYITDVGMTGPALSVIGVNVGQIIEKFLTQIPVKYQVASGKGIFCAVVIQIDNETGRASAIKRLMLHHD
ncbi:TIGR00282 family metallophosphoesterase [Candidatus Magnetominusculus xianensis]|uniref:Metallophosphoesterase n=1 Tax=Candidatus Magnetominusculus xianensis TaxID=1748249 RepID=A0ABR5SI78_9BACT|nr:TIGR00282 family metallophosphoesterase [Candidatus Magnetominusculus xianensis]KWT90930.1 metallophosphoesterase [Candidatus Magnetominusculus xianensis]MBF0403086.1 TIGR00282 family metallophosphoesterase [Nitrospirota bacterium]